MTPHVHLCNSRSPKKIITNVVLISVPRLRNLHSSSGSSNKGDNNSSSSSSNKGDNNSSSSSSNNGGTNSSSSSSNNGETNSSSSSSNLQHQCNLLTAERTNRKE
nr:bromodomain-containing protein DDB_G0271118-like [Bactrocera oleae]